MFATTNTHITNFYFYLSRNIFFDGIPSKNKEERLVLATSTPFIIRQSIEYKIKRILGIDYILLNDNPDKRCIEKYFKTINSNKQFYKMKKIDFEIIKKIHSWTHVYIHGGYRAEPWLVETALNYLERLFYSGETSKVDSFSLYAGIEVNEIDLNKIKANTENTIKSESKGKVEIKWSRSPEVAIIKTKA